MKRTHILIFKIKNEIIAIMLNRQRQLPVLVSRLLDKTSALELLVEKLAHSNQQLVTPPNKLLRRDAETTRSRRERKSAPERRDQHHRRENEADAAA